MAGPTDTVEQEILNWIFGKSPAFSPPANWFVALSTTTPTEAGGNFTEPVGNGYARVSTAAADWNAASGTAPVSLTNANAVTFPTASGSWGTATHFGLFKASSGGTVQFWGALDVSKAVGNGDEPRFAAGQLRTKLGDPADTY